MDRVGRLVIEPEEIHCQLLEAVVAVVGRLPQIATSPADADRPPRRSWLDGVGMLPLLWLERAVERNFEVAAAEVHSREDHKPAVVGTDTASPLRRPLDISCRTIDCRLRRYGPSCDHRNHLCDVFAPPSA